MEKSILDKKWKCYKPKHSNGFWYVETIDGFSICTTYVMYDGSLAKLIVKDHNEQLRLKRNMQKLRSKPKQDEKAQK